MVMVLVVQETYNTSYLNMTDVRVHRGLALHHFIIEFIEYSSSLSLCGGGWRSAGLGEQLSLRLMHRSSGQWVAYCLNAILSGRPRQPCVMPLTLAPAYPSPAASVPGDGPPAGSSAAGSGSGDLVSFIYVYLVMCHPWWRCCYLLNRLLSLEQQRLRKVSVSCL